MANEMIERVGRAIRLDLHRPEQADQVAARAIEAMRDPTMAMISAAVAKAEQSGATDFVGIWNAMVDAALGRIEGEE